MSIFIYSLLSTLASLGLVLCSFYLCKPRTVISLLKSLTLYQDSNAVLVWEFPELGTVSEGMLMLHLLSSVNMYRYPFVTSERQTRF